MGAYRLGCEGSKGLCCSIDSMAVRRGELRGRVIAGRRRRGIKAVWLTPTLED